MLLPVWHFCLCAFEKVEHIIHRQGHILSSRLPLLHPHNACSHAHSCQLMPDCLPMPITAGQFTFSTHSSRVLCPRCGCMLAPSVKKQLFFFHSDMQVCMCVLTKIQLHLQTVVCVCVYNHFSPQASYLAPCSLQPLSVTHPTPVCLSSTWLQQKKWSDFVSSDWLLVFLTMSHSQEKSIGAQSGGVINVEEDLI